MDAKEMREDTEKLCHQIYDVLPISPALKLLDDGKLYALITAHDETIRSEARAEALWEAADSACEFISQHWDDAKPSHFDRLRAAILAEVQRKLKEAEV